MVQVDELNYYYFNNKGMQGECYMKKVKVYVLMNPRFLERKGENFRGRIRLEGNWEVLS